MQDTPLFNLCGKYGYIKKKLLQKKQTNFFLFCEFSLMTGLTNIRLSVPTERLKSLKIKGMPGNQNVSVWTVSDRKKVYDDLDSYFSVCFQWLTFSGLVLQRASVRKRQVPEQFCVQWSLVSIGMSCLSWQSRRKVTVLQLTLTDTRTHTNTTVWYSSPTLNLCPQQELSTGRERDMSCSRFIF